MPFLNEENQTDETKELLEKYFWLKILRAGGMDVESAWKVMINYINLINNNPAYFTKAHPPAKLDLTYQQQVITTTYYGNDIIHICNVFHFRFTMCLNIVISMDDGSTFSVQDVGIRTRFLFKTCFAEAMQCQK